jgi:cytoskeleton protein RodZ
MTETVGPLLRAAREAQGRSLEEVEAVLHIRARHLAALEADDYAALPSLAQARGFLKNYAQYLGLDLQDTLGLYEAALRRPPVRGAARPAPSPAEALPPGAATEPGRRRVEAKASEHPGGRPSLVGVRSARRPSSAPNPPRLSVVPQVRRRRRWFSADVLVALVLMVLLGAVLVWGGLQLATTFAAAPTPTELGQAATSGPPATATRAPEATATVALPTPAASYEGINILVRAEQRTWVSVTVDGQVAFAGLMPPGEAREFNGQSVVEVLTGNGMGTRVIWNGVDQGLLGQLGEVVTRLWTLEGMAIPTPTPAPVN